MPLPVLPKGALDGLGWEDKMYGCVGTSSEIQVQVHCRLEAPRARGVLPGTAQDIVILLKVLRRI